MARAVVLLTEFVAQYIQTKKSCILLVCVIYIIEIHALITWKPFPQAFQLMNYFARLQRARCVSRALGRRTQEAHLAVSTTREKDA